MRQWHQSVFTWDYANRLAVATVNGVTGNYSYDGDNMRTGKTVGGQTASYVWDREADLPEVAADGTYDFLADDGLSRLRRLRGDPLH